MEQNGSETERDGAVGSVGIVGRREWGGGEKGAEEDGFLARGGGLDALVWGWFLSYCVRVSRERHEHPRIPKGEEERMENSRVKRMTVLNGSPEVLKDGRLQWGVPNLTVEYTPEGFRTLPMWEFYNASVRLFVEYSEDELDGEILDGILAQIPTDGLVPQQMGRLERLREVFLAPYTDEELREYFEHAVAKGWRVGAEDWWDQPSDVKVSDLPVTEAARLNLEGYDVED